MPPVAVARTADFDIFAQQSRSETLQDLLHWQLNLSRLDDTELAIATTIIDAIDPDGYLGAKLRGVAGVLGDREV